MITAAVKEARMTLTSRLIRPILYPLRLEQRPTLRTGLVSEVFLNLSTCVVRKQYAPFLPFLLRRLPTTALTSSNAYLIHTHALTTYLPLAAYVSRSTITTKPSQTFYYPQSPPRSEGRTGRQNCSTVSVPSQRRRTQRIREDETDGDRMC